MTFGLLAGGPIQMLFSLLLMQGLSLTMFRTFLNQAIPRFDPLRFSVNLGNLRDSDQTRTANPPPAPSPASIPAPVVDPRILPFLTLLQMPQTMVPLMPQMITTPQQSIQSSAQPITPQVIVIPQLKSSASTHYPVQVEAPPEIHKRILRRPPKTTQKPETSELEKIEQQSDNKSLNISNKSNISSISKEQSLSFVPFNNSSLIENNTKIDHLIHKEFIDFINEMKNLSQTESIQSPDESREEISFSNDSKEKHVFKRVCYYLLNAINGQLEISEIDPFICTHLIVGYATLSTNNPHLMVPKNPSEDPEKYRQLTNLKSVNRKLKVMLSVGDVSMQRTIFGHMLLSHKSRDNFVASALDVCDAFDFDGIDIDFEFNSYQNEFISLLKELRAEAKRRFRDHFIISIAIGTPLIISMSSQEIPLIADAVDFVNLMSYDFHYYRSDRFPYSQTRHNSPLFGRQTTQTNNGLIVSLNTAWSANYWVNKGMPSKKIMLGIPTYARTYNLAVPINQGLDSPVTGPGMGNGKLNYTAVCHFLSIKGVARKFDNHSHVPFAYKDFDWISYENELSVGIKAEWTVSANLGGIVTFAINYDDIKGDCRKDGKKFSLQKTISNLLEFSSIYQKVLPEIKLNSIND